MTPPQIRVLHVVAAMNRGGIERWLMEMFRRLHGGSAHFSFLVTTGHPGSFDEEIRSGGGSIHRLAWPPTPLSLYRDLQSAQREGERYHVLHSHFHHFNGPILAAARSFSARVAHAHTDRSLIESRRSWARRAYLRTCKDLIDRYATVRLAGNYGAGADLFRNSPFDVINYGVSLVGPRPKAVTRADLGIDDHDYVVGHVGRLSAPKNHRYLMQAFAKFRQFNVRSKLLLVGDGELRVELEDLARILGISQYVIFTGEVADASSYMDAMDLFAFPSLWEGMPLAVLEAQVSGLPVIASSAVPPETEMMCGRIRIVDLGDPSDFAEEMLKFSAQATRIDRSAMRSVIAGTRFDATESAIQLLTTYSRAVADLK